MIPVKRVPKPRGFDVKCRNSGLKWLEKNPGAQRPRDYWSPFKAQLATGFRGLCGYSAMHSPVGTVDHFESVKNNRRLAYEWSNYRFCESWVNSSKQTADGQVLDPYVVGKDWFEVLLPSLQLVVTDQVPKKFAALAEYTLKRLHLRDDERIIRQRRRWLEMYEQGKLTLEGLEEVAPLVGAAVRKAHVRLTQEPARDVFLDRDPGTERSLFSDLDIGR